MSIKIVHLSDTHLGFNDLDCVDADGINCREGDFYRSFRQIVDRIVQLKPYSVIHTGDFFHRPSPANRPMIEALNQLKRLSDSGIPFVVIGGNHSTPRTAYTSPILKAFKSIDGLYPIFRQSYETVVIGNIVFHGLPHINDEDIFLKELNAVKPVNGKINILMLHTSVGKDFLMEEYGERIFPSDKFKMLDNFNYVGAGHWHNFQKIKRLKNAYYSGSTERLSDRESGKEKGFALIEISDKEEVSVKFETISVRPWHRFDIKNCFDKSVSDLKKEIKEKNDSVNCKEAIISVYLHGVKSSQSAEISNSWLNGQFPGSLAVLPRRIFNDEKHSISFIDRKTESLDILFKEFLKKNAENDKEFKKIYNLAMKYFGKYNREE